MAQGDPALHFGLGAGVRRVDRLEVVFPATGVVRSLFGMKANREVLVVE